MAIPEKMELFCPYPTYSIMTDEAVRKFVDQKIVIRVGHDVYRGRVTQAQNFPERAGYTILLENVGRLLVDSEYEQEPPPKGEIPIGPEWDGFRFLKRFRRTS